MAISSPGIGSNLDVNGIVAKLMAVEQQPLTALDRKEASFQARISAFGSMKGALSSLQSAASAMATSSSLAPVKASVADSAIAAATAAAGAAPGSYSLEVARLASSQKLVSAGQASATAAIGTGTITFDFGTISGGTFDSNAGTYAGSSFTSSGAAAKTVTIDSAHSSLSGIRDAINSAKIGVTATIVNDGSGSPWRLALSVGSTGSASSVRISVAGDPSLSGLISHNPAGTQNLSEKATARDALFSVDGVSISRPTNVATDVIEGVTLSLSKVTTSATTITVARDAAGVRSSVDGFIKAYNDATRTLKDLSAYNASAKQGAILQGDISVIQAQSQLRATLGATLKGVLGSHTTLSQIGVSFQKDGTLALNATKFTAALEAGADFGMLFGSTGKATDAQVAYSASTADTKPGVYALSVSQLATQGTLTGSTAAGLTITAGVNDALAITVNGVAASVTLAAGVYASADSLAREVQSKINGASALSGTGISVAASQTAGVLRITSDRFGSASTVSVTGGNGATDLFGPAPSSAAGVDAAGSINGRTASGSGQTLTDASGSDSAGLQVKVTGGSTGDRGLVYFSRGYASRLDTVIGTMVGTSGMIAARTDGINESIKDIGSRREELNRRLALTEERLRAQFTALDKTIGGLSSISSFLTQQLATLNTSKN